MTDLLYPVPLRDSIRGIEAKAETFEEWDKSDPRAKALRFAAAAFRAAMRQAEDTWCGTTDAAELTGYHPDTLAKWAKRLTEGADVPVPWSRMQCELTPSGYRYRVSTVPPKPERKAG